MAVEWKMIPTVPVPITDGGSGQTTAQTAIDALTQVAGATNEYVLTKDTASGNALWKVAVVTGLDTYTKLLLHFDGTNASTTLVDNSLSGHVPTVSGGAQIDTAQSKFGGSSCLFDGTTDSLSIASDADFSFGTGEFTIDFWFRASSFAGNYNNAFDNRGGSPGNNVNSFCIALSTLNGNVGYIYGLGSGVTNFGKTFCLDTWYHLAIVGNGGANGSRNEKVYIDGVLADGATKTVDYDINKNLLMLGNAYDGNGMKGWIDEFRVSKGIVRWTADFTPPTVAYGDGIFGRVKIGYEECAGINAGLVVKDWFGLGTNAPLRKFHLYDPYGNAEMLYERGDQAADCKRFNIFIANNSTFFRALNDAGTGGKNWLQAVHSTGEVTLNYPLTEELSIFLTEQAADLTDRAGKGQIWVKNTTPNELWFTDDAGGATQIVPQALDTTDSPTFAGLTILERSSDPAQPSEGQSVIWMSDGTGYGDDGDVCIAATAGGVTTKAILFDKSAGEPW